MDFKQVIEVTFRIIEVVSVICTAAFIIVTIFCRTCREIRDVLRPATEHVVVKRNDNDSGRGGER
jgi:hypothetical protein